MRKTRFGGKHVLSSSTQFLCGLLLKNGLMPILCPGNYNYFICFAFWYSVHGEKDNHLTLRFFCSEDESGAKDKTTGKGGGRGKQQLAASAKPATAANTVAATAGWKEVVRKSKKVSVPSNAISRVIGRGGSNINAIR